MGHKSNLPSLSIKFEAQPRPNYGDMVWHIVKSENHEVRSNLYQMTRVIKCCWCRSTSPSWRTTTTMSSTTQHTHSDRCWCQYQGSGVVVGRYLILTSIYTLQLSQYEYEATLTIKNVSSVENGFEHFLYMTTRWEPQNPSTYRVIITFYTNFSINPNSAELVFNHKLDVQVW